MYRMPALGRRRNKRVSLDTPIQISWQDQRGNPHCCQAIAVDISDIGIRVELPEPPSKAATVQLRSAPLNLACSGQVRTCARSGNRFIVGIEFEGQARFDRVSAGIEPPARRKEIA